MGFDPVTFAKIKKISIDSNADGYIDYANQAGNADKLDGKDASDFLSIDSFKDLKEDNGYIKFPTGLIMQWGKVYVNNTTSYQEIPVNFTIEFPNKCLNVFASIYEGSGVDNDYIKCITRIANITTKGCVVCITDISGASGDVGFFWFAIGY